MISSIFQHFLKLSFRALFISRFPSHFCSRLNFLFCGMRKSSIYVSFKQFWRICRHCSVLRFSHFKSSSSFHCFSINAASAALIQKQWPFPAALSPALSSSCAAAVFCVQQQAAAAEMIAERTGGPLVCERKKETKKSSASSRCFHNIPCGIRLQQKWKPLERTLLLFRCNFFLFAEWLSFFVLLLVAKRIPFPVFSSVSCWVYCQFAPCWSARNPKTTLFVNFAISFPICLFMYLWFEFRPLVHNNVWHFELLCAALL